MNHEEDKVIEYLGALIGTAIVCFFLSLLAGCGSLKVSGETKHKVEGTATVVTKLAIDVEICDEFEGEEKKDCIRRVLDLLEGIDKPEEVNGSH